MDVKLEVSPEELMKKKGLGKYGRVQEFVDSECLRLMEDYTPMYSGAMIKSAIAGTVIGSGRIEYNSPYARYQYYGMVYGPNIPIMENGQIVGFRSPKQKQPTGKALQYNTVKHPLAGKEWFERMKKDHLEDIRKGAMEISEGGK